MSRAKIDLSKYRMNSDSDSDDKNGAADASPPRREGSADQLTAAPSPNQTHTARPTMNAGDDSPRPLAESNPRANGIPTYNCDTARGGAPPSEVGSAMMIPSAGGSSVVLPVSSSSNHQLPPRPNSFNISHSRHLSTDIGGTGVVNMSTDGPQSPTHGVLKTVNSSVIASPFASNLAGSSPGSPLRSRSIDLNRLRMVDSDSDSDEDPLEKTQRKMAEEEERLERERAEALKREQDALKKEQEEAAARLAAAVAAQNATSPPAVMRRPSAESEGISPRLEACGAESAASYCFEPLPMNTSAAADATPNTNYVFPRTDTAVPPPNANETVPTVSTATCTPTASQLNTDNQQFLETYASYTFEPLDKTRGRSTNNRAYGTLKSTDASCVQSPNAAQLDAASKPSLSARTNDTTATAITVESPARVPEESVGRRRGLEQLQNPQQNNGLLSAAPTPSQLRASEAISTVFEPIPNDESPLGVVSEATSRTNTDHQPAPGEEQPFSYTFEPLERTNNHVTVDHAPLDEDHQHQHHNSMMNKSDEEDYPTPEVTRLDASPRGVGTARPHHTNDDEPASVVYAPINISAADRSGSQMNDMNISAMDGASTITSARTAGLDSTTRPCQSPCYWQEECGTGSVNGTRPNTARVTSITLHPNANAAANQFDDDERSPLVVSGGANATAGGHSAIGNILGRNRGTASNATNNDASTHTQAYRDPYAANEDINVSAGTNEYHVDEPHDRHQSAHNNSSHCGTKGNTPRIAHSNRSGSAKSLSVSREAIEHVLSVTRDPDSPSVVRSRSPQVTPEELAAYCPEQRSVSTSQQRLYDKPQQRQCSVSPMRTALGDSGLTYEEKRNRVAQQREQRLIHCLIEKERQSMVEEDKLRARHHHEETVKGQPMRFRSPKRLSPEEQAAREEELWLQKERSRELRQWRANMERQNIEAIEQREREARGKLPSMRFGDTWVPPATEEEVEREIERRRLQREAALADIEKGAMHHQITTTAMRVHEATAIERRKELGNIKLTQEEYEEIERKEAAKERKWQVQHTFGTQREGWTNPHFAKLTKLQKQRLALLNSAKEEQQGPQQPKQRLLPGGSVHVSDSLLRPTSSVVAKKNDLVTYFETSQRRPSVMGGTPMQSSRVHQSPSITSSGKGGDAATVSRGTGLDGGSGLVSRFDGSMPRNSYISNDVTSRGGSLMRINWNGASSTKENSPHNLGYDDDAFASGDGGEAVEHSPKSRSGSQPYPSGGGGGGSSSHFAKTISAGTIDREDFPPLNGDDEGSSPAASSRRSTGNSTGPSVKMTAAQQRRAEANKERLRKQEADRQAEERRRVPLKKEEQLLSFERLQSTLSGHSSGGMRFA